MKTRYQYRGTFPKTVFFFGVIFVLLTLSAAPDSRMDEISYDFWIGEWQVTWTDSNGKAGGGINRIGWILDNKVIFEQFEAQRGSLKGFVGKSWSVFNPQTGKWRQTWVDNQGSYLDFIGAQSNGRKFFQRTFKNREGVTVHQRMVFYNIKKDSFDWDWERSTDGGKQWKLQWRIHYKRMGSEK